MGIGLAGDRLYTGGTYSHNIFLEIISGFGIIVGIIILLFLGCITIRSLFLKNKTRANLMLMWFCIGFVPLIVSGSYLTSFQFWIFLGLITRFSVTKEQKCLPANY
jgi:O-antigen ligase